MSKPEEYNDLFENCSDAEIDAFKRIIGGEPVSHFSEEIVASLLSKNLLDDHGDGAIVVPVMVWNVWRHVQGQ